MQPRRRRSHARRMHAKLYGGLHRILTFSKRTISVRICYISQNIISFGVLWRFRCGLVRFRVFLCILFFCVNNTRASKICVAKEWRDEPGALCYIISPCVGVRKTKRRANPFRIFPHPIWGKYNVYIVYFG